MDFNNRSRHSNIARTRLSTLMASKLCASRVICLQTRHRRRFLWISWCVACGNKREFSMDCNSLFPSQRDDIDRFGCTRTLCCCRRLFDNLFYTQCYRFNSSIEIAISVGIHCLRRGATAASEAATHRSRRLHDRRRCVCFVLFVLFAQVALKYLWAAEIVSQVPPGQCR